MAKKTTKKDKKTTKKTKRSVIKTKEEPRISSQNKEKVKCLFSDHNVTSENSNEARELYNKSRFGFMKDDGRVQFSMIESLFLIEANKIAIVGGNGKVITFENLLKKAKKLEPNIWIRYCVFSDIRKRGYIIKTALKFGADFRVYDRGVKPGEDHARWIVYTVHEASTITWHEFSAKNRVAHSTKKRLLIGVVDDEGDITYYEIAWKRP